MHIVQLLFFWIKAILNLRSFLDKSFLKRISFWINYPKLPDTQQGRIPSFTPSKMAYRINRESSELRLGFGYWRNTLHQKFRGFFNRIDWTNTVFAAKAKRRFTASIATSLGNNTRSIWAVTKPWDQKDHAQKWTFFPNNIGTYLSIDETSLSKRDLYTVLANKEGKGKKRIS